MADKKDLTNATPWDRKSITPSGFFGSGSEHIIELENFMTEEELTTLNNFIRNNKDWDYTESHYNEDGICIYDASFWEDRVASGQTLQKYAPHIHDMIDGMMQRLKVEVDKHFRVDAWATSPTMVRWIPGNQQLPHADKELHKYEEWGGSPELEGQPNDFPFYDIAGLFYVNDDYEGGELYFPEQGIEFKPKPGAAYFFPGDKEYVHGVRPIISGERYTCPFFFTILKHFNKDGTERTITENCKF